MATITREMARTALEGLTDEQLLRLSPRKAIPYCPHVPFPKQQLFLDLTCEEAFYGGSAGPGKTDGLLMAALQYVDVPRYSALILRRDFPRLNLPNSTMSRAKSWLMHSGVHWNGQDKLFTFPSGATLQFGYIDNPDDRFRYQSSEYQFIGFDELTEFRLGHDETNPYLFMFSRLRKTVDIDVPLRMRSASNPGQIGHQWVKSRFITEEALQALRDGNPHVFYADADQRRAFVPALLRDNPAVNADEYEQALMHLPPITRARLLAGDWSVLEGALINVEWLRYYRMRGTHLIPLDKDGNEIGVFESHRTTRLTTTDTAGTTKQTADEKKKGKVSWTCSGVWDDLPTGNGRRWLFLRDVWRARVDYGGLKAGLAAQYDQWQPARKLIENAHFGPALHSDNDFPYTTELISTATRNKTGEGGKPGKVERATELLTKLQNGEIFLPEHENSWKPDLEQEWLSWTGAEEDQDDQIDMGSYAAIHCGAGPNTWGGLLDTGRSGVFTGRF